MKHTIYGNGDATTANEKLISRNVSIKSIKDQLDAEYTSLANGVTNVDNSIDELAYLYKKVDKSVEKLTWAVKQMIALMNIATSRYYLYTYTNNYGGKTSVYYYPDAWVWTSLMEKYAPYIPGGIA